MAARLHSLPAPVRTAEEIAQRSYWEEVTGLQGRLLDCGLDAFQATTPKQRRALQVSRQFVADFHHIHDHGGGGLIYIGPCGTGKTTLAAGVTLGVGLETCYPVAFTTVPKLLRRLRDGRRRKPQDDEDASVTEDELIDYYGSFLDLLVLDDVDNIGPGADLALLYEVLSLRNVHRRPVVLTTNLTRSELRESLGDRAFDRVMEDSQVLVLDGPSFRTGST